SKTHHVGERIKLHAEIRIRLQEPRQPAVQRIKQNRQANRFCGAVKILSPAYQRRHNRVVATEQISHCEEARDEKDAPTPQFLIPVAPFLERDLVLFCFEHVHDRFPVEMRFASVSAAFFPLDCGASRFPGHLAIRLEPPFTFSPTFTRISAPFGSQTSTREPNRTSPMPSPHTTCSPCFFQETTRRAMSPAICLKTISPDSVLSVNTFCSFSRDARARMAAKNFPGRYSI